MQTVLSSWPFICWLLLCATLSEVAAGNPESARNAVPEFRKAEWSIPPAVSTRSPVTGDFNGDSFSDIAIFGPSADRVTLLLSNGLNGFRAEDWKIKGSSIDTTWIYTGDFDNDGATDIIACKPICLSPILLLSRKGSFVTVAMPPISLPPPGWYIVIEHMRGKDRDRVLILIGGQVGGHRLGEVVTLAQNNSSFSVSNITFAGAPIIVASEIWHSGEGPRPLAYMQDVLSLPPSTHRWAEVPYDVAWGPTLFADFNGDGGTDVAVFGLGIQGTWLILSHTRTGIKGGGVEEAGIELPVPSLPQLYRHSFEPSAGDFNGDGLADVLIREADVLTVYESMKKRETEGPGGQVGMNIAWVGAPKGPFICNGYYPAAGYRKWGRTQEACPDGYAVVETDDWDTASGLCCQLPERDILTSQHRWTTHFCPPGEVVTGLSYDDPSPSGTAGAKRIRCTAINQESYELISREGGEYWGSGLSSPTEHLGRSAATMPVAIRGAIGRLDYARWDPDGCVGKPVGAVLVSEAGRNCRKIMFAVIARKGPDGTHTPLPMFPDCAKDPNIFDPLAGCVPGTGR